MVNLSELRRIADEVEEGHARGAVSASGMRAAAAEIETLRMVRDGMAPAPEVRLMHYRAAALSGLIARTNGNGVPDEQYAATKAESYAQAMLAAERKAGT